LLGGKPDDSSPAPSTVTGILRRNGVGLVAPGQKAWKRFEHAEPNVLWQMDFKGDVMLTDNGSPCGDSGERSLTRFSVWLIKHGVAPLHSAPYHPQSHGKNERFNRTLNAELLTEAGHSARRPPARHPAPSRGAGCRRPAARRRRANDNGLRTAPSARAS
jgi:transposase InsO family protein